MSNEFKYRSNFSFKPQAQSKEYTPYQIPDNIVNSLKENQRIEQENLKRTGDQELRDMDIEFEKQKLILNNEERVANFVKDHQLDLWQEFLDPQGMGMQAINSFRSIRQKGQTLQAYKDVARLKRENPEAWKKLQDSWYKNVRYNKKNIKEGSEWAWTQLLEGNDLELVEKILQGSGWYREAIAEANLAHTKERIPAYLEKERETQFFITDKNLNNGTPTLMSKSDYYEALNDSNNRFHDVVSNDHLGDNSILADIDQNIKDKIYRVLTDEDGYFRYGEMTLMEHIDPIIEGIYKKQDLDLSGRQRTFIDAKRDSHVNSRLFAITRQEPAKGAVEFAKLVDSLGPLEGGHSFVFKNLINKVLNSVENGGMTRSSAVALVEAEFDAKEAGIRGRTGKVSLAEWRKKDFDETGFYSKLDEAVLVAGQKAEEGRNNAVTVFKGQLASYRKENGKPPTNEWIQSQAQNFIDRGLGFGLSVSDLVKDATEGMGTQSGETIANDLKTLETLGSVMPITEEEAANYHPTAVAKARENGWIVDSSFATDSTQDQTITKGIETAAAEALKIEGDYDKTLARFWITQNGRKEIERLYRNYRKSLGPNEALEAAINEFQKNILKDTSKWQIYQKPEERQQNTRVSIVSEYNQTRNSRQPFKAFEEDGRLEYLKAEFQQGMQYLNPKTATYISKIDGKRYLIFDQALKDASADMRLPSMVVMQRQLEGMGVNIDLSGQLQSLNADVETQRMMEEPVKEARVEVNSRVKDENLDTMLTEVDGFKGTNLSEGIPEWAEGAQVSQLSDEHWSEITGIDFSNNHEIRPILDKLGIKLYDPLTDKSVRLIQKRMMGLYGPNAFGMTGTVEDGIFTSVYNNPNSLIPELGTMGRDINHRVFPAAPYDVVPKITYADRSQVGLGLGTPHPKRKGLVLGIVHGDSTGKRQSVHLGWRPVEEMKSKYPWMIELIESKGSPFGTIQPEVDPNMFDAS